MALDRFVCFVHLKRKSKQKKTCTRRALGPLEAAGEQAGGDGLQQVGADHPRRSLEARRRLVPGQHVRRVRADQHLLNKQETSKKQSEANKKQANTG